jgi:tetratricopeptide (TPR) repeat protein
VADLYLVTRSAGPGWDPARSRPAQDGWSEHAAFMNGLVDGGFVVLGGPVSPTETVLVVRAADPAQIRRRLAADPWTADGTLETTAIRPWEILLGEPPVAAPASRPEWEQRVDALWAEVDAHEPDAFVARMDELAREAPDEATAAYERASAYDSTDRPAEAVALYREALERGLDGGRRRQAVVQLASSLRNLGRADESAALLRAEREQASDDLDDAVAAFLALALADTGREREAVSVALAALAPHLRRYGRSLAAYARALVDDAAAATGTTPERAAPFPPNRDLLEADAAAGSRPERP